MKIKEYEAHTLKEGLLQVRQDMGPDAVILETRKFRKGGIFGVGSRDAVRIVAAIGISVDEPRRPSVTPSPQRDSQQPVAATATATLSRETPSAAPVVPRTARTASAATVARAFTSANTMERHTDSATPDIAAARAAAALRAMAEPLRKQKTHDAGEHDTTTVKPMAPVVATVPPATSAPVQAQAALHVTPIAAVATPTTTVPEPVSVVRLEQEIGDIKATLESMRQVLMSAAPGDVMAVVEQQVPATPTPFRELEDRLVGADVPATMARELVDALPDIAAWSPEVQPHMAEAALKELMMARVSDGGPIRLTPGRTKAVALVGPVGVGKTTTIAKLAAHYALVEKRKVALVTMDTYRIAAVEQLKTYGQIIDLPVRVVYSPSEIRDALNSFAGYDLVLIDTAGRSQKNTAQIAEVKAMVEGAGCDTYLVLSASTRERDLDDQVERFSEARVDRLVFTKLDETNSFGTLFSVASRHRIPVSYLTTGQKVPEDIEIATATRLAELALGAAAL